MLRFFDRNTDSGNAKSACVPEVSANEKKSTHIPEAARPVGRSQVIVCSITRERLPRPNLPRADTAIPGIRKMVRLRDRPCSTQKDVANSRKEMACARVFCLGGTLILCMVVAPTAISQSDSAREYKRQVVDDVDAMKKRTQVMNDMVFSFAELGFQEFETSKYLTEILEKEGFAVERGIAGIPTAWMATWGSGKPVIALGSDIDCIPKASQKPGVARHEPLVDGAPDTARVIIRVSRSTLRRRLRSNT